MPGTTAADDMFGSIFLGVLGEKSSKFHVNHLSAMIQMNIYPYKQQFEAVVGCSKGHQTGP